jgi:hypothetical protein|uniref:Uncharacterized protein n=1 Tax=Picea glauca TaxID=3330 RepID=A0A124GN14_PICGL|nr:hypothetical protein ABT39_MTgene5576 [Picea glauca]QHR89574.1 hypothetical protein Q903MT_gene3596 [Picea sitchensis]
MMITKYLYLDYIYNTCTFFFSAIRCRKAACLLREGKKRELKVKSGVCLACLYLFLCGLFLTFDDGFSSLTIDQFDTAYDRREMTAIIISF